jgi:hypothetical protein
MKRNLKYLTPIVFSVVFNLWHTPASAENNFDFQKDSFFISGGCLPLTGTEDIHVGDKLLAFSLTTPPTELHVSSISESGNMEETYRKMRQATTVEQSQRFHEEIGCYAELHSVHGIKRIAHLSSLGSIAVRNLPSGYIAIGGDRHKMDAKQEKNYLTSAIPPKAQAKKDSLIKSFYYAPVQHHQIVEIFIGIPTYLKETSPEGATIDSIHISKYTFDNMRLIATEEFDRASDVEEHVDLPPDALDKETWWDTDDEPIGFLSLDAGKTWQRLTINEGFEGMKYLIQTLGLKNPEFEGYLYYAR